MATVIVMLGECTGSSAKRMETLRWGRMWIARGRHIYTYPGEPWGFDNGAFRDWGEGVPFNEAAYLTSLERARTQDNPPYLAVLPDIPAGGLGSLVFSLQWRERLREIDFPWYLAVQDGMTPDDVEGVVGEFEGIFLGGTSAYKATAGEWCEWAHGNGLRFHYGRAGTIEKLRHARYIGADSIDSAFPMWTRERWQRFEGAVINGPAQHDLFWED